MRRICIGILLVVSLCILDDQTYAYDRVYVIDSLKITLRTGPSNGNKIISFLNSGRPLRVLETQGDWCRVEVIEENGVKTEGWVLKQYLSERIPYKTQAEDLSRKNGKLTERLSSVNVQFNQLQKQKNSLSVQYQRSQEELNKLIEEFDALKRGSSEYLKLKAEYETAQAEMDDLKKKGEELDAENASLKESRNLTWFASGALVLLCGLLIGFMSGRQSQKRRSEYY